MEEQQSFVDYYEVLKCERTATSDELKKSYKRLILCSHPDKVESENDESFLLIQKAWSVLKDPLSRKQYDAVLSCHENSECLLYDTISLSDMELQCSDVYSYPCRCGGTYILETSEHTSPEVIIGCDECSFSIKVIRS